MQDLIDAVAEAGYAATVHEADPGDRGVARPGRSVPVPPRGAEPHGAADRRHDLRSVRQRVERTLNKIDGVSATVNYATEKASVSFCDPVTAEDLVAAVERAGYTAAPARAPQSPADPDPGRRQRPDPALVALRTRLLVCLTLTVPVIAMAMVPALQFISWQWASLTLAAPVVVWGALPFHRAAWSNLRHAAATMDTLVSVGTLAAFGWSLYALFLGTAGRRACGTRSASPSTGRTAPRTSTWRSPPG